MRIINGMESSMMAMNMDMNTMSMQMQVQMHMIIMMQMQMQMTSMKMMDKMDNMKLDNKDMKMGYAHSGSDEVHKGLKEAKNSTFKVGSQAVVKAHHREGMYGAKATIVGAYYTTAYAVTYTPTTGGSKVKNHKWVIQEEIKNAGTEILKPGTEVTLEANHMKGMMGAKGTIDSAEHTTVYMIDYTPTTGGPKVKNHKWVTESELSAK